MAWNAGMPWDIAECAIGAGADHKMLRSFWSDLGAASILSDPEPIAEEFCSGFMEAAEEVFAEIEGYE